MTNETVLLSALVSGSAIKPDFQPQNNVQAYLAYLNGLNNPLPEPRTAEEVLLYNLCANGIGGGSSGTKITDMSYLFYDDARLDMLSKTYSLCDNVTDCGYCFSHCVDLTEFNSVGFPDTSKCESMAYMFDNCNYLVRVDMSHIRCDALKGFNGSGLNYTFRACWKLEEVIGFLHKSSAKPNTNKTFEGCSSLRRLVFAADCGEYAGTSIDISGCSFERSGMVELFNSLPAITVASKLTIKNNPCVTGILITTVPEGEYDEYIEDEATLRAVIAEYVKSEFADVRVENSDGDVVGFIPDYMENKIGEFVYPVRVSWGEHTYETSVEKLTDEDRAIATNKGWTLVET